jgi:hypothetical protein
MAAMTSSAWPGVNRTPSGCVGTDDGRAVSAPAHTGRSAVASRWMVPRGPNVLTRVRPHDASYPASVHATGEDLEKDSPLRALSNAWVVRVPEVAVRGKGSRGCCVRWLIAGLVGLVFLGGLVVFYRGRRRSRPSADDTLVTDLLGPPDPPAVPVPQAAGEGNPPPVPQAAGEGEPPPLPSARPAGEGEPAPAPSARPAGEGEPAPTPSARPAGEGEPAPTPSGPPAGEDNWLESQLAWINAWSQRINQQITSAEEPEPPRKE